MGKKRTQKLKCHTFRRRTLSMYLELNLILLRFRDAQEHIVPRCPQCPSVEHKVAGGGGGGNELDIKLEGRGKTIYKMFDIIKAFEVK